VCKKSITNSQPFVKKNEKMSGPLGGFFDSHCSCDKRPKLIINVFIVKK